MNRHPAQSPALPSAVARPHTGRRRNEATRQAILDVTFALLGEVPITELTVEAIAAAASASRQTIYRWWPSKGAVIAEALAQRARALAVAPDTGDMRTDLVQFLTDTFSAVTDPATRSLLRQLMAAAQHDPHLATAVADFTTERRRELRSIFEAGQRQRQLPGHTNLDTLVDLAYGFMWYRLLVDHAPLDHSAASKIVDTLLPLP